MATDLGEPQSGQREPERVWLMQVPPKQFDEWLPVLRDPTAAPMLTVNRFAKELRAGDPAWLWVSGTDAGIYGSLVLMSDPVLPGPGFQHFGGVTQRRERPWINVQPVGLLEQPIGKQDLIDEAPELADLSIVRAPFAGTVHRLTADQDRRLREAVHRLASKGDEDRPNPWPPVPPPRLEVAIAELLRDQGPTEVLHEDFDSRFRSPVRALGAWICDRLTESGVPFVLDREHASLQAGVAGQIASLLFTPRESERSIYDQRLFLGFDDHELLWGLMPWGSGDKQAFVQALGRKSIQKDIWETVRTAKTGLKWMDYERDSAGRVQPPGDDGNPQELSMAEGLPKWADDRAVPVVRASVPYDDVRAMTSSDLGQWLAADLSRLVPLICVSLGVPVTVKPIDYPLPATVRRRADPLIFLSYRRSDKEAGKITELHGALKEKFPTRVFLDVDEGDEGIPTGSKWEEHLREQLIETALMVVAVSDEAMKSDVIAREIDTFLEQIETEDQPEEPGKEDRPKKPGKMLPLRVRRSGFDTGVYPDDRWERRLSRYQAPPGDLESREVQFFVKEIAKAYADVEKQLRAFYATPGNLERLEGTAPSSRDKTASDAFVPETASRPDQHERAPSAADLDTVEGAAHLLRDVGIDAQDMVEALPLLLAIKNAGLEGPRLRSQLIADARRQGDAEREQGPT